MIDIQKVDTTERPSNEAYDKYVYLIEIMKKYKYDDDEIYKIIPFKIKDIVFSSITYVANKALLDIANIVGAEKQDIESWIRRTRKNYFGYFCSKESDQRLVYDFDLISMKRIEKRTAASLLSLYTDLLNKEQVEMMVSWMKHSHFCTKNCIHNHPVASSISFDEKDFNPLNYWRGPVWMNINWMIYTGLQQHHLISEAKKLRKAIIDLVDEHGFYEYYNPLTGDGLGANNFSWTAALLIDLILDKTRKRFGENL